MAKVEEEDELIREVGDSGKYDNLLEEDSTSEEVAVELRNQPPGKPKKDLNLRILTWDLGSPLLHFQDVNWGKPCSRDLSDRLEKQLQEIVLCNADVIFLQGVVKHMKDTLKAILDKRYHIFFTEHRINWKWVPIWVPTLLLICLTIYLEVYQWGWLYTIPLLLTAGACCPDVILIICQLFYDERLNEIPSSIWEDEFDAGGLAVLVSKNVFGYVEVGEDKEPFRKGNKCCKRHAWHPLRIFEKLLFQNSMLLVKCQTHCGRLLAFCSTKLINEDDGDSLEDLLELHWRLCDLPSNCPTILGGNFNIHCSDEDDIRWKFLKDVDFQSVTSGSKLLTWDRANPLTQSAIHRYKKNGQPDRIFIRRAGGHGIRPSMLCPKCGNLNMPPRCDDCGEIILPGYAKGDKAAPVPNAEKTAVVFKGVSGKKPPLSDHYGLLTDICFKHACF